MLLRRPRNTRVSPTRVDGHIADDIPPTRVRLQEPERMSTKQVALTQASAIEFQLFGRHLESGIDRVRRRIDIFFPIDFNRNGIFE